MANTIQEAFLEAMFGHYMVLNMVESEKVDRAPDPVELCDIVRTLDRHSASVFDDRAQAIVGIGRLALYSQKLESKIKRTIENLEIARDQIKGDTNRESGNRAAFNMAIDLLREGFDESP